MTPQYICHNHAPLNKFDIFKGNAATGINEDTKILTQVAFDINDFLFEKTVFSSFCQTPSLWNLYFPDNTSM